ncbi:MAG: type II toxin-antitoxin system PemK/MazF family toxin [Chitinophagales bacterium]|nr:type II toxin-antitoxin system PemK/MazF family toxin [Chitinophagales bacterium]
MKKGDIILVPFPFNDLSGSKNRSALILAATEIDVTVAFISTQTQWKEDGDILLNPDVHHGLKNISLFVLSKFATLDKEIVIGNLGSLDLETMKQVNENLKKILGI